MFVRVFRLWVVGVIFFVSAFSSLEAQFQEQKERAPQRHTCVLGLKGFAEVARREPFDAATFDRHFKRGPDAIINYLLNNPFESAHFIPFYDQMIQGHEGFESLMANEKGRDILYLLFLAYKNFAISNVDLLSLYYRKFGGFFDVANQTPWDWARYYSFYRFFDAVHFFDSKEFDSKERGEQISKNDHKKATKVAIDSRIGAKSGKQKQRIGMDKLEAAIKSTWPDAIRLVVPEDAALAGDDLARRTRSMLPPQPAYTGPLDRGQRDQLKRLLGVFKEWRTRLFADDYEEISLDRKLAQIFDRRIEYYFTGDEKVYGLLLRIAESHSKKPLAINTLVSLTTEKFIFEGFESLKISIKFTDSDVESFETTVVFSEK